MMRFGTSGLAVLIGAFLGPCSQLAWAESRMVELAIHDGEASPNARVLSVTQDDEVVVRIVSDRALHIHLHGYDIESDIVPNVATSLRFTATATGRFPIEVHSSQDRKRQPLAYVEVRPR